MDESEKLILTDKNIVLSVLTIRTQQGQENDEQRKEEAGTCEARD